MNNNNNEIQLCRTGGMTTSTFYYNQLNMTEMILPFLGQYKTSLST